MREQEVSPELEQAVKDVLAKDGNLAAIKKLQDEAGFDFIKAKQWLVSYYARDRKPCPYCGEPLATDEARQCFRCGTDWHDSNHVVRRGDPEWNRFGLKRDRVYVVELCQEPCGTRYTSYRETESAEHGPHCVLETEPAPGWQFIEWGLYKYAQHLKLTTGERFSFEAHGIWMTEGEVAYEGRRLRSELTNGESPPWVNGIPPRFPPK